MTKKQELEYYKLKSKVEIKYCSVELEKAHLDIKIKLLILKKQKLYDDSVKLSQVKNNMSYNYDEYEKSIESYNEVRNLIEKPVNNELPIICQRIKTGNHDE